MSVPSLHRVSTCNDSSVMTYGQGGIRDYLAVTWHCISVTI